MRHLILILVFFSCSTFVAADEQLDPIIFMIDLKVSEGKKEQAEMFTHEISENVFKVEPGTVIYQYYFNKGNKAFLYEVYKSNEAAIEHVKNFRGSAWEKRFGEFFSIDSFAVLGDSSAALKKSLVGYTTDFRQLEGGYHKPAKSLADQIMQL